jgi:uncharacterized peroxidase-related enzyme
MSRLTQIDPEQAAGHAKELLEAVKGKLGIVPNMTRAMANAPSVLESYVHFSGALAKGKLSPKLRQQIALEVGQTNGCNYCLAAHSMIGKSVGLTAEQIHDARLGTASDAKTNVALAFVRKLVATHGKVSDADVQSLKDAGYDDGAIAEVVAHVALNAFTNYFNNVAETDIDFPRAEPLKA